MTGPGEEPAIAARLAARAAALPNLRYEGFVPYRDIHERFATARVLVNTSTYEGFPNTLVLAWLHGAVVLSLGVEPDGLLAQQGLGVVTADPTALHGALRRVLDDDAAYAAIASRSRAHAERHHDIRRIADQYEELFEDVLGRRR